MDTVTQHIPVFYASDDKYAPLVAVSMASVLFNTDAVIDFYILDCNMSAKNRRKIEMLRDKFSGFNLEFIPVDSNRQFGHIQLRNYLTTACFARFLIPDLKPNLGKIIYLDCDTLLFQDIAQFYAQDMGGHIMAAVPDPNVFNNPQKRHMQYTAAKLSDTHLYFNSGVMMLDIQKWRSADMLNKIIVAERETSTTRIFNDQDILNHAFDSAYQPLDVRFNVKSNLVTYCAQEDIVVRHFTGNIKPWLKAGFLQVNGPDFWFYAQMTPFFGEMMANAFADLGTINYEKISI